MDLAGETLYGWLLSDALCSKSSFLLGKTKINKEKLKNRNRAFTSLPPNHLHFTEEKKTPTNHNIILRSWKYGINHKPTTISDIHQQYKLGEIPNPCNYKVRNHFPAKISRAAGARALGRAQRGGSALQFAWWEGAEPTAVVERSPPDGRTSWQDYWDRLSGGRLAGARQPKYSARYRPPTSQRQHQSLWTGLATDACTCVTWSFCYQQPSTTLNTSLDPHSKEKLFGSCLTTTTNTLQFTLTVRL